MVRPLRIEYPGAVYHVTSRGDRREPIAKDDSDRAAFLDIVGQALERFDTQAWAYCLMGNHYHLLLHTRKANLSRLMRQINGVYTQAFNRRHSLAGHLFQGRFKAILVDSDTYLLEVCMQKQAGLHSANPLSQARGRKANVSKIHTNIPTHDSDVKRYAAMKFTSKDQRNQNIANAFYQGGHSQTPLALAFGISSSTVSRVVMRYENGV